MARTGQPIGRPPVGTMRKVRFSDRDWAELGAAAQLAGTDRSSLLRELLAWHVHRGPRVERPDAEAVRDQAAAASDAAQHDAASADSAA